MSSAPMPVLGDDLFTRAPGLLWSLIAWFTKARRESITLATHQGKFLSATKTVEARRPAVGIWDWPSRQMAMEMQGAEWCILTYYRQNSPAEQTVYERTLQESVGWGYSELEMPLQALDGLKAKLWRQPRTGMDAVLFRRLGDIWERGVICSTTANRPDVRLGRLPQWLAYGAPDDTWDYKINHSGQRWKVKACSCGWFR